MKLTADDIDELARSAIAAARRAGRYIATVRPSKTFEKPGMSSRASALVTDVDRRAEAMILEELDESFARFDLGLLTEERPDNRSRFDKDHFWCIDPLDGTLAFAPATPFPSPSSNAMAYR